MAKTMKKSKKSHKEGAEIDNNDSSSPNSNCNSNLSDSEGSSSSNSNKSVKMERKHANKKQHKHKDKIRKKVKKEKHKSRKKKKKKNEKQTIHLMQLSESDNNNCEKDVKPKNLQMDEKLIKSEKELQIKTESADRTNSKWESPQVKKRSRSRSRTRSRSHSRSHGRNLDYKSRQQRVRSRSREYIKSSQSHNERNQGDKYQRRHDSNRNSDNTNDYKERRERRQYSRSPRRSRDRSWERNSTRRDNYPQREYYNKRRNDNDGRNSDTQNTKNYEWGGERALKMEPNRTTESKRNKQNDSATTTTNNKPDYGLSGILAEDTNKVNGVVIKYSEPPEARKPKRRWRLYPFKGETALPVLHIHRQSCFLVGRDRKVADLAVDHPSCSKQHAALQYRLVSFQRDDGTQGKRVRLYVIDLDSANGTFLNNKRIESRKYYELMEKDVIKFGFSTREYVLLHENSKEDQEDDDVKVKDEPAD